MVLPSIQQELVELTSALIRIPSVHSRPAEIDRCADFIGTWLSHHQIPFRRTQRNGFPSLVVAPDDGRCRVLLMSHFDVVEADERQFSPYVENERLFGRGAIDDKYAVALSLILYRETLSILASQGRSAEAMPLALLFTGDEEVGGANGAGALIEQLHPDYFIAIDGGRPDLLITKEKGILGLTLTARGQAAHAARPWLGESAFDILVNDYLQIQSMFAVEREDHWHPTMVLSNCQAGTGSTNMVPATATATLDIRYTENEDPHQLLQEIRNVVRSEVTVRAMEPLFLGGESPHTDLLARLAQAEISFEHGASDARYFSRLGIPGSVWGAAGEMSQHTSSEHVVIQSLADIYDVLERFTDSLLSEKGS